VRQVPQKINSGSLFMGIDERVKLKALLNYWIEHNREHSQEFTEWAGKAKEMGEDEVCEAMLKAVQKMDSSSQLLVKALEILGEKK
jgi:hypothetical protein